MFKDGQPGGYKSNYSAFTLVELLVVISIIALLLAIAAPSVNTVREHTLNTECQSNMRQLVNLMHSEGAIHSVEGGLGTMGTGQYSGLTCPKSKGFTLPPDLRLQGKFQSDSRLFLFTERNDYKLPTDVRVEVTVPGRYQAWEHKDYPLTPGTIDAGTVIDCYLIHFDPQHGEQSISSSIMFPAKVIGIIAASGTNNLLNKTDHLFGPGTIYETYWSRGCEKDWFTLKDDGRTIDFNLHGKHPGDQLRVITKRGPEGAWPSYAVNKLLPDSPLKTRQIALVEYDRSVAVPDEDNFWDRVKPRHFGKVNVAFMDGSVKGMAPENINFQNSEIREEYWEP